MIALPSPEVDALEILRTTWEKDGTTPLPVDPVVIAKKLGVRVYTAEMEPNVSGMLFMNPGKDPEIYLNAHDSYNRQRFTCAHELGHWRKHVIEGTESVQLVDYRGPLASAGEDPSEIYANQFAANLLMPENEVRRLVNEGYGPVAIADRLRVSVDAVTFRLNNLKLFA